MYHAEQFIGNISTKGEGDDRYHGTHVTECEPVDDIGGRACGAREGDISDWLVAMRGHVLGEPADDHSRPQPTGGTYPCVPLHSARICNVIDIVIGVGGGIGTHVEVRRTAQGRRDVQKAGQEESGGDDLPFECLLDLVEPVHLHYVRRQERCQEAGNDPQRRNHDWIQ